MKDRTKETIDAAKHVPAYDASRINRAVERAARNPDFVNRAVAQLQALHFRHSSITSSIMSEASIPMMIKKNKMMILSRFLKALMAILSFAIRTMCKRHLKKMSPPRKRITR